MLYFLSYIFVGFFAAALLYDGYKENPGDGLILVAIWPLLIPWSLGIFVAKLFKR